MDQEIVELARTAGTTVVSLLTTDAWQRTRDGLVALWHHVRPERAADIAADLDATREELLGARAAGDKTSEDELRTDWQGRLRRLLLAEPALAEELRGFLDELRPYIPGGEAGAVGGVRMRAHATGHGRVYQAGRDQNINEG